MIMMKRFPNFIVEIFSDMEVLKIGDEKFFGNGCVHLLADLERKTLWAEKVIRLKGLSLGPGPIIPLYF